MISSAVHRMGDRLADPLVGKEGVFQIVAQ